MIAEPKSLRWTPELVEKFWNGFGSTRCSRHFAFSRQAGKSFITAIAHLLPHNGTILDYGAGDGYLVGLLCERGLRTAAYEPSLKRAQNLEELLGAAPTFLGVVSADNTDLYDVVIAAEVIEHVLDEELDFFLNRLRALVRPNGLLIITTPNNEDLELGMAYCPVSETLFHRWQHVRAFTDRSLVTLLEKYGFEELVSHQVGFVDSQFVPYDPIFSPPEKDLITPSHIQNLRANQPTKMGSESNLLFIGRRLVIDSAR